MRKGTKKNQWGWTVFGRDLTTGSPEWCDAPCYGRRKFTTVVIKSWQYRPGINKCKYLVCQPTPPCGFPKIGTQLSGRSNDITLQAGLNHEAPIYLIPTIPRYFAYPEFKIFGFVLKLRFTFVLRDPISLPLQVTAKCSASITLIQEA